MVVRTGVGKWAAAGAAARWYDPSRHGGILSFGVAGALPPAIETHRLVPGAVVLGDTSLMGDEGVVTPEGFLPLDQIGFSEDAGHVVPDPASFAALAPLADAVGPIATVSACSGTDAAAMELARRTGALAEAMEGAAVAMAVRRLNPQARFAELRVISNTTGDRTKQVWDLPRALSRMREVLGPCLNALIG